LPGEAPVKAREHFVPAGLRRKRIGWAFYNFFTIHEKSQNWRLRIWKAVDEAQNVYCQGEFDDWLLLIYWIGVTFGARQN